MARPEKRDETIRAFEAFEFWFFLPARSDRVVAKQFKVSSRCVVNWRMHYDWDRRAQDRERKIKTAISNKHDAEAVKSKTNLIAIADATMARYAARLLKDIGKRDEQGVSQYEPNSADAARWAQLKMLLLGEATSRADVNINGGGSEFVNAFFAMMATVLRKTVPRACPNCKTDLHMAEDIGRAMVDASARLLSDQSGGPQAPPVPPAPPQIAAPGRGDNSDEAGDE